MHPFTGRYAAPLLWPRLTPPRPPHAVADILLRNARRDEEVSQGKTLLLRSGAAGFTCARVRMTIGRPRPLPVSPTAPALYPISVRQLRAWPQASSPPRLAATQLPSARGSHHQGPQRTSTSSINAMPGTQSAGRSLRTGRNMGKRSQRAAAAAVASRAEEPRPRIADHVA